MKCIKSNSKDLALLQKNLFQINSVLYIHQRIQKKVTTVSTKALRNTNATIKTKYLINNIIKQILSILVSIRSFKDTDLKLLESVVYTYK